MLSFSSKFFSCRGDINLKSQDTSGPTQTKTKPKKGLSDHGVKRKVPGLVLAWSPPLVRAGDRCPFGEKLLVGRGSSATWRVVDDFMSRNHVQVSPEGSGYSVVDLGSHNGSYLNGKRLDQACPVQPGDVIRAGSCVFVVVDDLSMLAQPGSAGIQRLAGRFYSPAIVLRARVASNTGRHILLYGQSGTGKELISQVLHGFFCESGRKGPLIAHNGACFTGEEDAVSTLFGVVHGAFTGVGQRQGAIESAHGGTLFLDEVHNLPVRVQRSLLRFIEDGLVQKIGSTTKKSVDVRMIFGTNCPVEKALEDNILAHDLIARLHRVTIEPLAERRADIPDIFLFVLNRIGPPDLVRKVVESLDEEIVEKLILRPYGQGNVRELEDMAAFLIARLTVGDDPRACLLEALAHQEPSSTSQTQTEPTDNSTYEFHREEILAAYAEVSGNISKLESLLRARSIPCSRRWLSTYLERWGVRKVKHRQK